MTNGWIDRMYSSDVGNWAVVLDRCSNSSYRQMFRMSCDELAQHRADTQSDSCFGHTIIPRVSGSEQ